VLFGVEPDRGLNFPLVTCGSIPLLGRSVPTGTAGDRRYRWLPLAALLALNVGTVVWLARRAVPIDAATVRTVAGLCGTAASTLPLTALAAVPAGAVSAALLPARTAAARAMMIIAARSAPGLFGPSPAATERPQPAAMRSDAMAMSRLACAGGRQAEPDSRPRTDSVVPVRAAAVPGKGLLSRWALAAGRGARAESRRPSTGSLTGRWPIGIPERPRSFIRSSPVTISAPNDGR